MYSFCGIWRWVDKLELMLANFIQRSMLLAISSLNRNQVTYDSEEQQGQEDCVGSGNLFQERKEWKARFCDTLKAF